MKCPYCDEEMRSGYIQGGSGVFFTEKKRRLFIKKRTFHTADKTIALWWNGCASPAFYCDTCESLVWKKGSEE